MPTPVSKARAPLTIKYCITLLTSLAVFFNTPECEFRLSIVTECLRHYVIRTAFYRPLNLFLKLTLTIFKQSWMVQLCDLNQFTLNISLAASTASSFPRSYTVVLHMFPAIKVPVLIATSLAIFRALRFSSLTSSSRPITFNLARCP